MSRRGCWNDWHVLFDSLIADDGCRSIPLRSFGTSRWFFLHRPSQLIDPCEHCVLCIFSWEDEEIMMLPDGDDVAKSLGNT